MIKLVSCIFCLVSFLGLAQKTIIIGCVKDGVTKSGIPSIKVQFQDSKIGTLTDSLGNYRLETYYATDSIQISILGYKTIKKAVKKDQEQTINITLPSKTSNFEEITILPPDELPSIRLHKRVIAHKQINNKEKLDAYAYEVYNKIQLDINNLDKKFEEIGMVKKLDLVLEYLDTSVAGKSALPVMLSESVSDYYYENHPKKKKEIVKASRATGIENIQVSQFLGDMYLEINPYENIIDLFGKSFISPLATYARGYYQFVLTDSSFIDNNWCYLLTFKPKRSGDLAFEGEMWINDTTYAVKKITATIAPGANLNYIQDFYFEQNYKQVEHEVWMLVQEKLIMELMLTQNSKLVGVYGRKTSTRKDFIVNKKRDPSFYNSGSTIEIQEGANNRTPEEWESYRHTPLNFREIGIQTMIDSLNKKKLFTQLKTLTYMATTGYYPIGKIELGSVFSLVSGNPVEKYRFAFALRTSDAFSKKIELGGKIGYGIRDQKFKYNALIRYNVPGKKRGMLSAFYNFDIQQIGQSPSAAALGTTFSTVFNTAPFDKLTFVKKIGLGFEKDIKKDIIIYTAAEWKQYNPLGLTSYLHYNPLTSITDTLSSIRTAEFTGRLRWTKDEEFISGSFSRTSVTSVFPIFSLQAIIGVKGIGGSQYNYQKLEFQMEHYTQLGVFGRMRYGCTAGYIFGATAYPFLKVHEGNQSFWLLTSTFNKLNFMEFISDRYVMGFVENHWEGLFFDRIPVVKKLKFRMVTMGRIMYGAIDPRHSKVMLIPSYVKQFGNIPYAEVSIGIENIAKIIRVDLVWRMTHNTPGISPLGIRARYAFNF